MFIPIPEDYEKFLVLMARKMNNDSNIKYWINWTNVVANTPYSERFFSTCSVCNEIIKAWSFDESDTNVSIHGWNHLKEFNIDNIKVFL